MGNKEFMRKAIELSVENVKNGGGPFGAVIVKGDEIVATGVKPGDCPQRPDGSCGSQRHSRSLPPTGHLLTLAVAKYNILRALPDVSRCHILGAPRQNILR